MSLSALQVAVAMAVASGAPGLEAAVVLDDEVSDLAGVAAVRDVSASAAILRVGPDGYERLP